jgi:predicted amidophosphoribosyltransferase
MFCLACTAPTTTPVCARCAAQLPVAPETLLDDGTIVIAAYHHEGPARRLVHALKYRAVTAAAVPFAVELADRIPTSVTALVPVPRAWGRVVRYGIDPASVLAAAVSEITRLPVVRALRAPLWWRRHAGASRSRRAPIRFTPRLAIPPGAALVDDVVTTGVTVMAAAAAFEGLSSLVLAATVAPKMVIGENPSGGRVTSARDSGTIDQTDLRVLPFEDDLGASRSWGK